MSEQIFFYGKVNESLAYLEASVIKFDFFGECHTVSLVSWIY